MGRQAATGLGGDGGSWCCVQHKSSSGGNRSLKHKLKLRMSKAVWDKNNV